jgi:flagellar hook-associated protein 1 FlgK
LKDQVTTFLNGDKATFGSYYGSMIGQIGRDVADANSNAEQQETILTQLISHRDAVSGVSVDEEMMNILKYQMGYNAAGRLCQTVNELLDTLMNLGR